MQLGLNFGEITIVERGDLEHNKFFPEKEYMYLKIDCPKTVMKSFYGYRDYEFTYKYVRYICSTNYRYEVLSELYSFIISKIEGGLYNDDIMVDYYTIGNKVHCENDEVMEVIVEGSYGRNYYVIHKLIDLDINLIKRVNMKKHNISNRNIELLDNSIKEYNNNEYNKSINKLYKDYVVENNRILAKYKNITELYFINYIKDRFNVSIGDVIVSRGIPYIISDIRTEFFEDLIKYRIEDISKIDISNKYNIYCRRLLNKGNFIEISDKRERFFINHGEFEIIDNIDITEYKNRKDVSSFFNNCKNSSLNIIDKNLEDIEEYDDNIYVDKNCHTYIMKNRRNGLYKIGKSVNPKVRERTLQSEDPDIIMVKKWDYEIEKYLHKEYSDYRVRGEWFNLSKVQVEYICTVDLLDKFGLKYK
jgi:hypothetical protein